MRKVILGLAVSLDGLIEGPNGEYDWCFTDQDYGIAVVRIDSDEQLKQLIDNDPANGLNSYEIFPIRAVTKEQ